MSKQPANRFGIARLGVDDARLGSSEGVSAVLGGIPDIELPHPGFYDSGKGVDAKWLFRPGELLTLENELVRWGAQQVTLDAVPAFLTQGQCDRLPARFALPDSHKVPGQTIRANHIPDLELEQITGPQHQINSQIEQEVLQREMLGDGSKGGDLLACEGFLLHELSLLQSRKGPQGLKVCVAA